MTIRKDRRQLSSHRRAERGAQLASRSERAGTHGTRGASPGRLTLSLIGGGLLLLLPLIALAQDARYVAAGAEARTGGGMLWAFYIIGALTVAGAVATITRRNPITAAMCLVGTLAGTAGIYLLLHATFLAAMQVLVYAGAIMVLFVFVVMSVEHPEEEEILSRSYLNLGIAIAVLIVLFLRLFPLVMGPEALQIRPPAVAQDFGSVTHIGKLLFSDYLFPFEAISLLLLVAIVGAVVINRRRSEKGGEA
jgi:NADH-quinone oxidoreductase subunit J